MNSVNIILVDDHPIVRQGIRSLLEFNEHFNILGEADQSKSLFLLLNQGIPDVIILDISLPHESGIEICRKLQADEKYREIKCIILSMFMQEDFILNAIQAGAKSYLPKNTGRDELFAAIEAVMKGDEYFSPDIAAIIMKSFVRKAKQDNESDASLSKREIEILQLFSKGMPNQEIADKLFISIRTVESHKNHIMQKLGLKNSVDLVKYAIKAGLTEL
ncbi:MAG: response regulator transcription factor [Bacteroidales bacterium]|jgi:DNA-binding NarL/FixJ family response regulator|nr:response regulator transcription factor [Bacteroidales bacterium]